MTSDATGVRKVIQRVVVLLAVTTAAVLATAGRADAGTYYVYACSSYGNTAPAFTPYSNADHLSTADGCMQPAPSGGYRSLEINNPPYGTAPVAHGYGANWTANSPSPAISIVGAYTPVNTVFVDCYLHTNGFTAEYFWSSGTQAIDHVNGCNSSGYGFGTGISASFAPSSYFGWGAGCWLASSCSTSSGTGAVLGVQGIRLTAEEDSGPSVTPDGSNNLFYQSPHWVRGGGWPVSFTASDASGVCAMDLVINGQFTSTDAVSDPNHDASSFTQCWPTATAADTLDTHSFSNGAVSIGYGAFNAAGVFSNPSETLQVDNTPVTLALSTPDDADPISWVNHPVHVVAAASAGPSDLRGTSCSTNSGASYSYPSGGITLNGTGTWTVSCSSQNNAFDVNGEPARSPTQSVRVHIDESPPTIRFEPPNASDPQGVVVDSSDGQSGVASGEIQMRPASGGNWNSLTTHYDGSHLLAHFDDSELLPGPWLVEATACDNAGNCASSQEPLTLPVRTPSLSSVGFGRLTDSVQGCHLRKKAKRHHGRAEKRCRTLRQVRKRQKDVSFGRHAVIHGILLTAQGLPIAEAPVAILTAPDDGLGHYTQLTSVKTDSNGVWTATLPPGPSRLIAAAYGGSPTLQPSDGSAKLVVPASVRVLRVWPRRIPWGGKVHIRAQLVGGFLPTEGALVRLRLGYGNAKITYGVREHVGGDGVFEVTNAFGAGPPAVVRHYWLQECTLPEGDYPFAPACGPRSDVAVG